ncbi:hypothetical protein D3C72_2121590 [compost metagenome]
MPDRRRFEVAEPSFQWDQFGARLRPGGVQTGGGGAQDTAGFIIPPQSGHVS